MHFCVRVRGGIELLSEAYVITEGQNWFGAFVDGLAELDHALDMQNLSFSLLDDGVSAVVRDPRLNQLYEVMAVEDRIESPEPIGPEPAATPIPKTVCAAQRRGSHELCEPRPTPDDTDAFEADAVMRLTDLLERFSDSREEGAELLLDAATKLLDVTGGGVVLHDRRSATPRLLFQAVSGTSADRLLRREVKLGQGPVGVCAHLGVSLNIKNLAAEAQLSGGVICQVGLDVGPMLCVPISRGEILQGVVVLYRGRRDAAFTADELGELEQLAVTLGAYLRAPRSSKDQDLTATCAEGLRNRKVKRRH